jgi:hypothetical protein
MRILTTIWLLAAMLLSGCNLFAPERYLYSCGGTSTYTPDGVEHCTGGVPVPH